MTKPGFRFFLCSVCIVAFFYSRRMFVFVVLGSASSVLSKRLAGKNVFEMTYFVVKWDVKS